MRYACLSDAELDEVVRQFIGENEEMRANAFWDRLAPIILPETPVWPIQYETQ